YLLVGDSDFLYLYLKKIIKESNTDVIETKLFDCSDKSTSQQEILNTLNAIDLFAEKNLIIIKNINKISAKNKDIFKNALSDKENPNRIICVDHSFLGFDYGSKQNFIKNPISKDISDLFTVIDITTPFESEMIRWIRIFSDDLDFKMTRDIANSLIDIFGTNFSAIYNEISKLSIIAEDIDSSKDEWLDSFYDWKKNKQIWEFNYAVCDKDVDKILAFGSSIMNQFGLLYMTNSIFTIFEALFYAKLNNGTITDNSRKTLRGKIINKISSSSNKYTLLEIETGIKLLSALDKKIKTRNIIDESEFTNLISGIFRNE
ncbi:MAG: DNA polymerase III subunit delta, partial [Fidelibacterota bacterium]